MASIMSDLATVRIGARDPWPDNVSLYQPYEVGQILLPDFASCLAVKTFLKMCGLKYRVELRTNAEAMSPTGKVPFIQVGPLLLSEVDPIISYISLRGHHLSEGLSDVEKGEMKAYMALVDNVLANAELYISWCLGSVATKITKPRYGSPYPWPLNSLLPWQKQREVKALLTSIGWAQKSFEQVCEEVHTCCQALSERLKDREFFFGNKPTELDAVVHGHLYTLLTTTLPLTKMADIISSFPNLPKFCRNIDECYFKDKES